MLQTLVALLIFFVAPVQAVKINQSAPAFTLTNSAHQKKSLSDYKGKVVLVNFWASWCGPCQVELPQLNRLAAEYKTRNVRVLAINVDQDAKEGKSALARLGLSAPRLDILWDSKSKVVSVYNIETMPSSFVIDRTGVIRFIHEGFHPKDPELWRKEIDSLIAQPNR